jgi:deazaflavin-dependent oxidoreductase (nitroreductase family)
MLFGKEHVDRYRETGGAEGHEWQPGVFTLLLTTKGRRTGREHTTPLIYREAGEGWAIVASKAGAPDHPDWYLNLTDDPNVTVQIADEVFPARARTAGDDEKAEIWPRMAEVWPDYDEYQKKTDRPIPVVVLERS